MKYEFFVPGIPVAQPRARARAFRNKAGNTVATVYNPQGKATGWKESVWTAARMAGVQVQEGEITCSLTFIMPRPKYMLAKKYPRSRLPHIAKPDRDNLDKSVLDALKGIAWLDDCQVCYGVIRKLYQAVSDPPDVPGVYVLIAVGDWTE